MEHRDAGVAEEVGSIESQNVGDIPAGHQRGETSAVDLLALDGKGKNDMPPNRVCRFVFEK